MPADFTLERYADIVRDLLEHGYEVRGFQDADPDRQHLILRHDIDMSIENATVMAETEAELGVTATYFPLLRSNLYNPFSARSERGLGRLLELGHQIGLHFDASLYPEDRDSLERACGTECATLETIVGRDVEVVSFHRPAKSLLGADGTLAGRRHAYEPRFFEQMGYCSDSRGAWHHGTPLEHEAVQQARALQLLTHPIWWVGVPHESVNQRLDRLAFGSLDRFRQDLAANCEPYRTARVLAVTDERD